MEPLPYKMIEAHNYAETMSVPDEVWDAMETLLEAVDKIESYGGADESPAPKKVDDDEEVKPSHNSINDQLSDLFDEMLKRKFCFDTMKMIADRAKNKDDFEVPMDLFTVAADRLLLAVSEIDIRVRTNYLNVFYVVFMATNDFNSAMRYVYSLNFKTDNSTGNETCLPHLHTFFTKFDELYQEVLDGAGSSTRDVIHYNKTLAFLLLISPRATLRRIVVDFIDRSTDLNILMISKALRRIPAYFELQLPLRGMQCKSGSILIALLYRFLFTYTQSERTNKFEKWDVDLKNPDKYNRLISFFSILTTTRIHMHSGDIMFKAAFDVNELIVDFICQQIAPDSSLSTMNVNFAIDLLSRLLRKHVDSSKNIIDQSIIKWKYTSEIRSDMAVDLGVLLHYLSNLCMIKTMKVDIKQKCFQLINSLIEIVKERAQIPIDADKAPKNETVQHKFRVDLTAVAQRSHNTGNGPVMANNMPPPNSTQIPVQTAYGQPSLPIDFSQPPPTFRVKRAFSSSVASFRSHNNGQQQKSAFLNERNNNNANPCFTAMPSQSAMVVPQRHSDDRADRPVPIESVVSDDDDGGCPMELEVSNQNLMMANAQQASSGKSKAKNKKVKLKNGKPYSDDVRLQPIDSEFENNANNGAENENGKRRFKTDQNSNGGNVVGPSSRQRNESVENMSGASHRSDRQRNDSNSQQNASPKKNRPRDSFRKHSASTSNANRPPRSGHQKTRKTP